MINECKVQWYKLRRSPIFYLMIGFYLLMAGLIISKISGRDVRITGTEMFLGGIGDTSLLFGLTLFVSYFIGMDFKNRTIENEIRIGYSRWSVLLARSIVVLPVAVGIYIFAYVLPVTVGSTVADGLGAGLSVQGAILRLVLFCIQVAAVLSFTILFMFVSNSATVGMMVSVCFTFLTCNLLRNFLDAHNPVFALTSFCRIMMNEGGLNGKDIVISALSATINTVAVLVLTYHLFKREELK